MKGKELQTNTDAEAKDNKKDNKNNYSKHYYPNQTEMDRCL